MVKRKKLNEALGMPELERQSFEQQMNDLGVEVVKTKAALEWYKPATARRNRGLGDKISINKSGITLGKEAVKIFERNQPGYISIEVGIIKKRNRNYLAIRPVKNESGFTVTVLKKRTHRMGTKKLVKWLSSRGIKQGVYELREVKGGYMAIPEAEGLI